MAHGLSCSTACGILPDQGSNLCPLHYQADSYPLRHQRSPLFFSLGDLNFCSYVPWSTFMLGGHLVVPFNLKIHVLQFLEMFLYYLFDSHLAFIFSFWNPSYPAVLSLSYFYIFLLFFISFCLLEDILIFTL